MADQIARRTFLKAAGIAAATTPWLNRASSAPAGESKARPDILFLMPDQMRGDCLSALNHPAVRTPRIDGLASGGVLFRRAYTTVSSCIPARFGLMTGLCPQTSGVVGFAAKPIKTPTLPDVLNEAGYQTFLVGRNMHQKGDCGYQKSILGSTYVNGDDYDQFLKAEAPETGGIRKVIKKLGIDCNHWPAKCWPLEERLHPTNWIVETSRKVLADADADKPIFLTTSFYAPHPPLFPPKKYWDACAARKLPKTAHGDWVDWPTITTKGRDGGHRVLLEGKLLADAQAGYFGLIDHLDRQIEPLIAEFKARSEKAGRPWIIAFTADHGEMLGDHGYFRKCEPYEGSANIPMIFAASPELGIKPGRHINQPVCLEDIKPTLLALAGLKCPGRVDGVDLTPTLRGRDQEIRPWLHFEHSPCYSKAQAYHALTDGRYKYIWRPTDGDEQLFDLENDPTEEKNLAAQDACADLLATWRGRMIERLTPRPEGFVQDGKLVAGRPYKALNAGTL